MTYTHIPLVDPRLEHTRQDLLAIDEQHPPEQPGSPFRRKVREAVQRCIGQLRKNAT